MKKLTSIKDSIKDSVNKAISILGDPDQEKGWEKFLEEKKEEKNLQILLSSNLPSFVLKNKFFINGLECCETMSDSQDKMISVLNKWDPEKKYNLPYIFGPPGIGKTYLSSLFGATVIKKFSLEIYYTAWSEFFLEYRKHKDIMTKMLYPYVLIADDFGAHNITKMNVEAIHLILSHRLRENKPTLITSNIDILGIAEFLRASSDGKINELVCNSIQDRILELCTMRKMKGESIRQKKALESN